MKKNYLFPTVEILRLTVTEPITTSTLLSALLVEDPNVSDDLEFNFGDLG